MTKLDDILSQTANDISLGVVTGEWKQSHTKAQIQALVKEVLGDEIPVHLTPTGHISAYNDTELEAKRELRQEQIERAKQLGLWEDKE